MEISRHFETVPRLCPTETRKRRNLPPLPFGATESQQAALQFNSGRKTEEMNDYVVAEKIQVPLTSSLLKPILKTLGRLQMQIWNNCREAKLALTINQASNLQIQHIDAATAAAAAAVAAAASAPSVAAVPTTTVIPAVTGSCSSSSGAQTPATSFILVVGRVIFEEQATKTFRTNPVPSSSKPVWNETFLFEYNESVEDATLEICAHETKSPNDLRLLRDTFLGMIILPLSEANLEDEPRWYELRVRIKLYQKS